MLIEIFAENNSEKTTLRIQKIEITLGKIIRLILIAGIVVLFGPKIFTAIAENIIRTN